MAENTSAADTLVKNIEARMTIARLAEVVAQSGLAKHGEIRSMLIERFDLGVRTGEHGGPPRPPERRRERGGRPRALTY